MRAAGKKQAPTAWLVVGWENDQPPAPAFNARIRLQFRHGGGERSAPCNVFPPIAFTTQCGG